MNAPASMKILIASALLLTATAWAEEVPTERGVTLLLKIVTYDTHFDAAATAPFLVLVPFDQDKARAEAAALELVPLSKTKIKGRPLAFQVVSAEQLEVASVGASAILAMPGLGAPLLTEITRVGQQARLYTLGLSEVAAKKHVALGVLASESGKPEIIINVVQTRAIGAEFPPAILKVAKLIQ